MLGTMQDFPLTLTMLFRHGARIHSNSEVVSYHADRVDRAKFGAVARRTEQLAAALKRLGIGEGDRVGRSAGIISRTWKRTGRFRAWAR